MEAITSLLSPTKLIDVHDISKLRNYIDIKFNTYSKAEKAKILSRSIHSILDRSMEEFDVEYREKIKVDVIKNTLLKDSGQICHKDILNTCMSLDIKEDRFIDNLQYWIVNQANLDMPKNNIKKLLYGYTDDVITDLSMPQTPSILAAETPNSNLPIYNTDLRKPVLPAKQQINPLIMSEYFKIELFIKKYFLEEFNKLKRKYFMMRSIYFELKSYISASKKIQLNKYSPNSSLLGSINKSKHSFALINILAFLIPLSTLYFYFNNFALNSDNLSPNTIKTNASGISQKSFFFDNAFSLNEPNKLPLSNELTDVIDAKKSSRPTTPAPIANDNISVSQNPGVPKEFLYIDIDCNKTVNFLKSRNSILVEYNYLSNIILAAKENDINPYLLLAIAGQEQAFVPRSYENAQKIANNPFNIYRSWKEYNTDILDSSRIVCKTIINLLSDRPQGEDPFVWLNRLYAEDKNWWIGVKSLYNDLAK